MPEEVLPLPGTVDSDTGIWAQVEEDLDEVMFEDDELEDDEDWDDLEEPDELSFDEDGDGWDDNVGDEFESFVADTGDDEDEW